MVARYWLCACMSMDRLSIKAQIHGQIIAWDVGLPGRVPLVSIPCLEPEGKRGSWGVRPNDGWLAAGGGAGDGRPSEATCPSPGRSQSSIAAGGMPVWLPMKRGRRRHRHRRRRAKGRCQGRLVVRGLARRHVQGHRLQSGASSPNPSCSAYLARALSPGTGPSEYCPEI
jgi:hypothetical protein